MSGTDILTTSEELRAGSGKKMLLKVRECQSLGSNVRQTLNDHIYVALEQAQLARPLYALCTDLRL